VIASNDRQALFECLRNQHPVERIAMEHRKSAGRHCMAEIDRESSKTMPIELKFKVIGRLELTKRSLDGNLPNGRDRNGNVVGWVRNDSLGFASERLIPDPPEQDMGVE
jgi:hypothetical protein